MYCATVTSRVAIANETAALYRADGLQGVRVLVADDEPDARNLVRRVLEECGAEVHTAESAAEALKKLSGADAHPDVKLADWSGAVSGRLDLLAGDQVHPQAEGGRLFADTVAAAVEQVELDRAMAAYYLELYAWTLASAASGT